MEIELPYNWKPRVYQLPLWKALESGVKRAVCVWHRRAGKDTVAFNWTIAAAHQRIGVYYHFFPTYNQGRKILWDGIIEQGRPFLSYCPNQLIESRNNTEMKLKLKCGSLWQIVGTDNINTIMGTNPVGCIFSEYALQNPLAYEYIKPILAENDGWAIFLYTPRGHNHGYDLYEDTKILDDWFTQLLTVEDTVDVIPAERIAKERAEGMSDELVEQEYYCSFNAPLHGSYYGKLLAQAEADRRIANVPYDPAVLVDTHWDLGVGDSTAIWFSQSVGKEIRFIDYYETSGEGLSHYKKILQNKPYSYGEHVAPHDIENRELGSGKTRKEMAAELGIRFRVAFNVKIEDGINAVRMILPRCWFDQEKCKHGLKALKMYHREWDDKMLEFKNHPFHDWSSHAADAFRYFAVSYKDHHLEKAQEQKTALADYDEFGSYDQARI